MRHCTKRYENVDMISTQKEAALDASRSDLDKQTGYSVGVSMLVRFDSDIRTRAESLGQAHHLYTASNVVFSGMQSKLHAEQAVLHQFLMDAEEMRDPSSAEIVRVIVATSDLDGAVICGHCLQVFRGACEEFGFDSNSIMYHGMEPPEESSGDLSTSVNDFNLTGGQLSSLMPKTYAEQR